MIKTDKNGIPLRVQKVNYRGEIHAFKITLFTGKTIFVEPCKLLKKNPPGLMDYSISDEQLFDAYEEAQRVEWTL